VTEKAPRSWRWRLAACALCAAGPALSAPADPMLELLRERGVLDAPAAPETVHPVRDAAGELVLAALNFLDIQYHYGGNSAAEGFDCSGFTRHVFQTVLGLTLPRRSDEQARQPGWDAVPREALQPGDLVFFNTMRRAFSHVGIYVGDGRFIHAPRSGAQVRIEHLGARYWARRFDGGRRVGAGEMAAAPGAR